jgi:hypothetical protein
MLRSRLDDLADEALKAPLRNHAEIVLGSGAAVALGCQPSLIRCFAEGRAMDPPEGSIRAESVSHRCGIWDVVRARGDNRDSTRAYGGWQRGAKVWLRYNTRCSRIRSATRKPACGLVLRSARRCLEPSRAVRDLRGRLRRSRTGKPAYLLDRDGDGGSRQ